MTDVRGDLEIVAERLAKVVYLTPHKEAQDGLQTLLDDARWMAKELKAALDHIDFLTGPRAA